MLEYKAEEADRRNGMRAQLREVETPKPFKRKKAKCTCTPKVHSKLRQSMVYEGKQCTCGYGTVKMKRDQQQKEVRLLWSPVDEILNDETVTNFQRMRAEKLFLPSIPGTAPPAGYNNLPPRREVPGTAPGGRAATKQAAAVRRVAEKLPNADKLPEIDDRRLPPDDFSSNIVTKANRGKYYDFSKTRVLTWLY